MKNERHEINMKQMIKNVNRFSLSFVNSETQIKMVRRHFTTTSFSIKF